MPIGNQLFNSLAAQSFSRLQGRIADLQAQVSTGKNDPKASADPMRASTLSGTREQQTRLEGYQANTNATSTRLAQTDTALSEVLSTMQRLQELALTAASDTSSETDRNAIRLEVQQLRKTLIDIGNRRDEGGIALFSGYANPEVVFADDNGRTAYFGNNGTRKLQVSESMTLQTALPGSDVFLNISGGDGRSLFDMAEDLAVSLSPAMADTDSAVKSDLPQVLSLTNAQTLADWTFELSGPSGRATISLENFAGSDQALADAINVATQQTGISAQTHPDGGVTLNGMGTVGIQSVQRGDTPVLGTLARLSNLREDGGIESGGARIRDTRMDTGALAARMTKGHDHVVAQRAILGSMAAAAQTQSEALDNRKLALNQTLASMENLDIAAALTELQSLLLTQQAAQQSHARLSAKTLFDYL